MTIAARASLAALAAAAVLTGGGQAVGGRPRVTGAARDDTAWLQARLDAGGGRIFLPKLPNGGCYASRVRILHCHLVGGGRNVISAVSFIDLRIEDNTISGATNGYRPGPGEGGNPSAGIDVEPNSRGELALDLRIAHNTIADDAGPGILLALSSVSGLPLNANRIEIVGNHILRNGRGDKVV